MEISQPKLRGGKRQYNLIKWKYEDGHAWRWYVAARREEGGGKEKELSSLATRKRSPNSSRRVS
jgi:hypothetical protein